MLARRSFVLLLMWPLTLILGSLDTLQHTVLEEPHDYRARKQSQAKKGEHLLTSIYTHSSRCSDVAPDVILHSVAASRQVHLIRVEPWDLIYSAILSWEGIDVSNDEA
jgi:hypothetical protein